MKILLRLYPAAWRLRYGEELEVLIDDAPLTWHIVCDVLVAAVKEQFNMQSLKRLIAVLAVTGLIAGFLVSFAIAPRYTAHGTVELRAANAPVILADAIPEMRSRSMLATLINDPVLDLYETERKKTPLEDVEDKMRRDFTLTASSNRLTITFTYRDQLKAQRTVYATVADLRELIAHRFALSQTETTLTQQRYLDQISRLETRIAGLELRLGITSAVQSRPAPSPYEFKDIASSFYIDVIEPNRAEYAGAGFAGGVAAALLIALLRRRPPYMSNHVLP